MGADMAVDNARGCHVALEGDGGDGGRAQADAQDFHRGASSRGSKGLTATAGMGYGSPPAWFASPVFFNRRDDFSSPKDGRPRGSDRLRRSPIVAILLGIVSRSSKPRRGARWRAIRSVVATTGPMPARPRRTCAASRSFADCHAPSTKEGARRRSWFGAGRGRGV